MASALSGCRIWGQIVAILKGNFHLNVFLLKVTNFFKLFAWANVLSRFVLLNESETAFQTFPLHEIYVSVYNYSGAYTANQMLAIHSCRKHRV